MRVSYKSILLSIFLVSTTELTVRAQQPHFVPLPVEEALQSSAFPPWVPVSLSPNGQWVGFTLQETRKLGTPEEPRYSRLTRTGVPFAFVGSDVWIANTRTGESRNLTGGKGTNWGPVWSPDGRYLAFSSDRSGASRLWLWEASSSKLRQLGDACAHAHILEGARWTPDSKHIIIRVLPEGMKLEDLLDIVHGPREQRASQGKDALPSVTVMESHAASATREQQRGQNVTEYSSSLDINLGDLAVIDIAGGGLRRIARRLRLLQYRISPDGAYVAAISFTREAAVNSQEILYELSLVSLATRESRVVASNIRGVAGLIAVRWSPDGKFLAYTSSDPHGKSNVFVAPASGGEPRNLTSGSHPDFAMSLSLLWDPIGQSLYSITHNALWKVAVASGDWVKVAEVPRHNFLALMAARGDGRLWSPGTGHSAVVMTRDEQTLQEGFYRIDLTTGESIKLIEEAKCYSDPRYAIDSSADGQTIVYLLEDAQHSPDVWAAGVDLRNPRRVTSINPQFDRYLSGATRLVNWRSEDGQELRGALLLPAGYEAGKRYPLVVWVYGGALLSTELNKWGGGLVVFNMQLLATRGYAVLFPDAPQRVGTPLQDTAKAVLPGVEKVVELGIADPERLGVIGQSYGGYSTLALIVQSTRFKAAVVSAGPNNLMYAYARGGPGGGGIGWVEEGQGKMGGSLWQFRGRYIENSPLFYFDRIQTPVLIMQGASDTVVPPVESQIAFESLRRLGKEVAYASYAGEDHSPRFWGYANQVDYVNRVIAWFDCYLKGTAEIQGSFRPLPAALQH